MSQGGLIAILWTVSFLCLIATIYPYVLYPLILRTLPEKPILRDDDIPENGCDFALVFCAYNEAKAIPDKLQNLWELRAEYPELELLAYDDCSSDGTAELIENSGLDIKLVRGERTGKAHGMKSLASLTQREFIVFTDANVELDPDALRQLRAIYADQSVGGVCGQLLYVDAGASAVAMTGGTYWKLEEMIKSLESRSGNVMGADGSVFSIRRSLYPSFPDSVLDDLTVSMSVIFQARRLIKDPRVIGRERIVASRPDDFSRRVRIATRAFHTHLWFKPQIRRLSAGDRWRYWSHRYLRWHGAAFIATGYLCVLAALAISSNWAAVATVGVASFTLYLAGSRTQHGPISAIVHITASILITGIGVTKARRGGTMTTWQPPTR
jgi:cellulose synthase/poly-beta-1,6-N-acetylglucosamine synthase-like glycosyltransferase